jgi:Tol biopolymer transport system component
VAVKRLAVLATAVAIVVVVAPAQATLPGRNGEILITQEHVSGSFDGEGKLVAIHPRTGATRIVWQCVSSPASDLPECDNATTPALSPDGRTAAVLTLEECCVGPPWPGWHLNLIDVASGSTRMVDFNGGVERPPTDRRGRVLRWLPDGSGLTTLVYGPPGGPSFQNRRLGLDGTLGDPLGPPGATGFDWSTDGRAAFVRGTSLWVLAPDGGTKRLVRNATDPSWSPRGRWVAFTRKGQIWAVDARGGRPRRLTSKGGERPAWSPDGRRIAFFRIRDEQAFLYVLDPRGGRARRILEDAVEYPSYGSSGTYITSPPEWRPLPR